MRLKYLLLPVVCSSLLAQHNHTSVGVLIDGKAHPEQISEFTAVISFLRAATVVPSTDPRASQMLAAQLRPIGLSPADERWLRIALEQYKALEFSNKPQIEALGKSISVTRSVNDANRYRELKRGLQGSAYSLYLSSLNNMSPTGQLLLRAYLLSIRRQIRVVAQPAM